MSGITEGAVQETPMQRKIADLVCATPENIKDREEFYTPFPIESFLTLFSKAHYDCCIDYMEGGKLLASWLSPVFSENEQKDETFACKYHMLGSYDLQKLAPLVGLTQSTLIIAAITVAKRAGDL